MLIASKQERFAGDEATAELQEKTRWLQDLYERHAYLVYNLALRITCSPDPARASAEQAFMGQLDTSEDELVRATVRAALRNARGHRIPSGAGGSEQEELLAAAAALTPSERAALALEQLADGDADAIADALGVDAVQAASLLERAHAGFAVALALPLQESQARAANWLWADPPPAVWDDLYKSFHQTVWRRLQDEGGAALAVAAETATVAADEQPTTVIAAAAPPRRRRRPRNLKMWAMLVAPLLLVGGAWAYQQNRHAQHSAAHRPVATGAATVTPAYGASLDTGQPSTNVASTSQSQPAVDPLAAAAKRKKPLTPKELDALRLQELRMLRKYEMQQADKRLTQAQRDYAAQRAGALQDLARRRADAKARQRDLTRQQRLQARRDRELAKRQREQQQSGSGGGGGGETVTVVQQGGNQTQKPSGGSGGSGGSGQTGGGGSSPNDQSQASQQCLQDQDTGQYICQTP